jgi:hypothetical protein
MHSVGKIRVIGVLYPVFHSSIERTLVIQSNVHVAVPGCNLYAKLRIGRLRFPSRVAVRLAQMIRDGIIDILQGFIQTRPVTASRRGRVGVAQVVEISYFQWHNEHQP